MDSIKKELDELLYQIVEMDKKIHKSLDISEKEELENKLSYIKERANYLTNTLNKKTTTENVATKSTSVTTVHKPTADVTPRPQVQPNNNVAYEPKPRSAYMPPPQEPSEFSKFLKDNLKVLLFSSFVFIGIVWLFVYISSLTSIEKELQIGLGFTISLVLIGITYAKELKPTLNLLLKIIGYIVGIMVLLFGAVVLNVIPTTLAIVISIVYVGYSLHELSRLNSQLYTIIITSTSLLLTFAYMYVDAPIEVLFLYVTIIFVAISMILSQKDQPISKIFVPLTSLGMGTILMVMSISELGWKLSTELYDKHGELDNYDVLYDVFLANALWENYFIVPFLPILLILATLLFLYKFKDDISKGLYTFLFATLFSFELTYVGLVYGILEGTHVKVISTLLVLIGILVIVTNKNKDVLKNFGYLMAIVPMLFYIHKYILLDDPIILSIIVATVLLVAGLFLKSSTLKVFGFIYIIIANSYLVFDGTDALMSKNSAIQLALIIVSIGIYWLYKNKFKPTESEKLDSLLYGKDNVFTKLLLGHAIIVVAYQLLGLSYTINLEFVESRYAVLVIPSVVLVAFITYVLTLTKEKQVWFKYNHIFAVIITTLLLIVHGIAILPSYSTFTNDILFMDIILFVILAIQFVYIITNYKKLNFIILNKLVGGEDGNKVEGAYIVRVPLILTLTHILMSILIESRFNTEVYLPILFGAIIIYLIFEISKLDKLNVSNKAGKVILYILSALYLLILVFGLLYDVSFIIKAVIFLAIGIYGLFTAIKK